MAFCMVLPLLLCACSDQQEEPVYEDVEDLSQKLGYTVIYPRTLPGGCHADSYTVLSGNIAQITCLYQDTGDYLYYRIAQGADLKLGAGFGSTVWTETITVGSVTIYVSGAAQNEISAAQWTVADFSYAILSDQPLSPYFLLEIIASIA